MTIKWSKFIAVLRKQDDSATGFFASISFRIRSSWMKRFTWTSVDAPDFLFMYNETAILWSA